MIFHAIPFKYLLSSVERKFQHDPDALRVIISHVCIWRVLGNRCWNIFVFYFDKNKDYLVLVFCLFSGPDWTFVLTCFMRGIFTGKYVRNLSSDKENFCELLTSYIWWKTSLNIWLSESVNYIISPWYDWKDLWNQVIFVLVKTQNYSETPLRSCWAPLWISVSSFIK